MKLLKESSHDVTILTEGKDNDKKLYIEGVTLVADSKNKNNRIYPKDILKEAIKRHKDEFMESNRALGELNHPKEDVSQINLENVSHRFVEVQEDGCNFKTKALVLETDKGKIAKNLIDGGVKLGISSRGFGDIKESKGVNIVENLYLVSLGDIVANPSAPGAFLDAVMEKAEWIIENGVLVKRDIEPEIDEYQKLVEKTSKKDRDIITIQIFRDYFSKIL